jgi:ribonuclease BN (tRNA processing enzyme)
MSAVVVQFLGCGDTFGSGGRFQTCIAVRAAGACCLIDCGASSLIAMRRFGLSPDQVDAILISHLHGDHFGGLPFFLLDAQLITRRTRPLVLAGPPGLRSRLGEAMEALFPGSSRTPQRFTLDLLELPAASAAGVGPLAVTPYPAVHPSGAPAYALRIGVEGKVITYSADTEWTDALLDAARGADLFICEAYFFDKKVKYHLDYQTLMSHRAELGCARLILTHMSEDMLGRRGSLAVECAEDGMSVTL